MASQFTVVLSDLRKPNTFASVELYCPNTLIIRIAQLVLTQVYIFYYFQVRIRSLNMRGIIIYVAQ